ncbi:hypothetical protein BH23BAC1_BH23BAC1_27810 [soil metagenome]
MLQQDQSIIIGYFYTILTKNISGTGQDWLDKSLKKLSENRIEKDLFTSFSLAPRFVGKAPLQLTGEDLEKAKKITPGFDAAKLTTDQAARILIILSYYNNDAVSFKNTLEKIFNTADIQELVSLYAALPILPHPEDFTARASEGVRTNMTVVFDTIALNNPFPSEYLNDDAWNQMVLKAVFINRPLYKIYGFDKRRNAELARMLSDFAHERWAAGRKVPPELWRATGPFLEVKLLNDIQKLLHSEEKWDKEAGTLACYESQNQQPKSLLSKVPEIKSRIDSGNLTWDILGQEIEKNQT